MLGLAEVVRVYEFRGEVAQNKLGVPSRLPEEELQLNSKWVNSYGR